MRPQKPKMQFDREKLADAVHFICEIADSSRFGAVHLHKALYFSDMLSFLANGTAITGVQYLKQKFGPTARHLSWALRELERRNVISVEEVDHYGYSKKKYNVRETYAGNRLSVNEKKLLSETVSFVEGKSAREISEFSHNAAWESVGLGEEIPYHSVYRWLPSEITDDDVEWANDAIRTHAFPRPG